MGNIGFFLFGLKLTALTSDPEVWQGLSSSKAMEEAGHGEQILLLRELEWQKETFSEISSVARNPYRNKNSFKPRIA
jgi:hypothetical protein